MTKCVIGQRESGGVEAQAGGQDGGNWRRKAAIAFLDNLLYCFFSAAVSFSPSALHFVTVLRRQHKLVFTHGNRGARE
jgi:hypothetical protein